MENLIDEIDGLIRAGRAREAAACLTRVDRRKVPKELHCRFAALARRLNLPEIAIRLLNRAVRPTSGRAPSATEEEKAEYAASLIRVGAVGEALEILQAIDAGARPEALLYQCFALFSRWDYEKSVPLLDEYVVAPGLSDYQRAIGRANLAAALVYERHSRAEASVSALVKECREHNYHLLYVNALMMQAEYAIFREHWEEARRFLEETERVLEPSEILEALFVRKWHAILDLYRTRSAAARKRIENVRKEAERVSHWETLRNCDYHVAVALGDESVFRHVYAGTPYESLRSRMCRELGGSPEIPSVYGWDLGTSGARREIAVLLPERRRETRIKLGGTVHRTLSVLCRDFYRPMRLASLHAELYPKEYFNPDSSPGRVHQAVRRTKRWLRQTGVPLAILCEKHFYRLGASRSAKMMVPVEDRSKSRLELLLQSIEQATGGTWFSARKAREILGMERSTCLRVLALAVESGRMERKGNARATRYRVRGDEAGRARTAA